MLKRKEFIIGAVAGLAIAAAATAGGIVDWPGADARNLAPADAGLVRTNGDPVFAPPPGAPLSFADIVEVVSPAVVSIDVRQRAQPGRGIAELFGGLIPGQPGEGQQVVPVPPEEEDAPDSFGSGSGFFISSDGYIVTNNHVVADAEEITVRLNDDRELTARIVGVDEGTDLAVLKVDGENFPYVQFETEARPRVGDWVLAIGNPLGLGGTVTAGVVSAYGRQIDTAYVDYMQIDAPINRGNSGGPTFDIYGRVIGVNTAIFSPNGYSVGIGFAIPADVANRVTRDLIENGRVERGYVGLSLTGFTDEMAAALGLDLDGGAFVAQVNEDGPADRGGLREGDIVVALNGDAVENQTDLTRRVGAARAGETLTFSVLRQGRRVEAQVRTVARPSETELNRPINTSNRPTARPDLPAQGPSILGMNVVPASPEQRRVWGLDEGAYGLVVTGVAPRSDAARADIPPGVAILQANGRAVETPEALNAIVEAARAAGREQVLLLFRDPTSSLGPQNVPILLDVGEARALADSSERK